MSNNPKTKPMRIAKFNVPVSVLTEFQYYINAKGLKSKIISKKDDMCNIEIPYTKEQASIIDELEELVNVLVVVTMASMTALSYLIAAAQKSESHKNTSSKATNGKACFFKDFVTQNVKSKS
jgi:hypothetical protein